MSAPSTIRSGLDPGAARSWSHLAIRWAIAGADGTPDRWLEWRIARDESDGVVGTPFLIDRSGVERPLSPASSGSLTPDHARAIEHVDLPAALAATLRLGPDGPELLYASTSALAHLGVRCGQADQ